MKKLEVALLLGMAGTICCSGLWQTAQTHRHLEESVLRLHILANSDSIDDQALKLKVRDKVLAYANTLFSDPDATLEETENLVCAHLSDLETVARSVLVEEGAQYDVDARLVTMEFEARTYGEITMPAGEYEALRITIGEAKGQNWWCVMYPSLCVPSAVETDTEDSIEETYFAKEEQALLKHPEQYQVKLKCLEWIKKWFSDEKSE